MGVYKSAIVTEAGQSLIAQAIAGEGELLFSSAKTSSYAYPEGTNIAALTGLQDIVQSVTPFSSQVFNDTVVQVSSRFSNEDVTSAYMIQTLGLYAQLNGGAETLFAVVQATTPDQVPVQSSVSPSAFIFNVQMTIQQASQITVTVNPAGTATVQDVLNIQNDIAALENPEFDDSGTVSTINNYNSFYNSIVSKMSIFDFFRNLKAGLKFMLNVGQLVTDTATNNDDLVAAASAVYKNAQAISSLNAQLSEARTYSRTTPGDTATKIRLEGTYSFQPFLLFGNVESYLAVICFNNGTPVVTNWGTDKFQVEAVSTTSCNVVIPSYNRITIISSDSFSYYSLS